MRIAFQDVRAVWSFSRITWEGFCHRTDNPERNWISPSSDAIAPTVLGRSHEDYQILQLCCRGILLTRSIERNTVTFVHWRISLSICNKKEPLQTFLIYKMLSPVIEEGLDLGTKIRIFVRISSYPKVSWGINCQWGNWRCVVSLNRNRPKSTCHKRSLVLGLVQN